MSEFDPHYGIGRAADYIGVHRTTLTRYIKQGKLKIDGRAPNGDIRIKQSTLDRLLQQDKHKAAAA